MTYLQLVNLLKLELGVAGDDLATIIGQTAMKKKLVEWIANADVLIQSKHWDWNFMWANYQFDTVVGNCEPTVASDLGVWDRDSFYLDKETTTHRKLDYIDWRTYRDLDGVGVKSQQKPSGFTIKPDNSICLREKPDDIYSLTAEYWKRPTKMTLDADVSPIPEAFQRIIVVQAKLWYGEEQEYPLVIESARDELNGNDRTGTIGLLRQLESKELPYQEGRNMGAAPDMTVVPE